MNSDDAEYLIDEGSIDWGTVTSTHHSYNYPSQIGEFISATTIGARTISIVGWVIGSYEEIRRKKALLNKFINPQQPVEIIAGGYSIVGSPDSQVKYSNSTDNNDVMCRFIVSLYCNNPVFSSVDYSLVTVTEIEPKFMFPLTIPTSGMQFGVRKVSLFTDLINDGSLTVGAKIVFTADGIVNTPRLFNVVTMEYVQINTTLHAGDVVTIDTNNGSRSVTAKISGIEQNFFGKFDYGSTWLQFPIGTTILGFKTYDSNNLEDETYKNLSIQVFYHTTAFNLEEE